MNINKIYQKILSKTQNKDKELIKLLKSYKCPKYFEVLIAEEKKFKVSMIIEHLKLKKYENNQIIFNYNDTPDGFYIVLKSKVDIFIPNKNKFSKNLMIKNIKNLNHFKENFIHVKKLKAGKSFGENALIHEDGKRTATCIANYNENKTDKKEICLLGFLKKNDFVSILKNIELIRMNRIVYNLLDILKIKWSNSIIKILNPLLEKNKITLKKNNYLFKKNDILDGIYLIFEGEVSIIDYINLNELKKNYDNEYSELDNYKLKNFNKKFKYELFTFNKGYLLGINEFDNNLNYFDFSCKIKSNKAKFFKILKVNMQKIFNDHPNIYNSFNQYNFIFKKLYEKKSKIKNQWARNLLQVKMNFINKEKIKYQELKNLKINRIEKLRDLKTFNYNKLNKSDDCVNIINNNYKLFVNKKNNYKNFKLFNKKDSKEKLKTINKSFDKQKLFLSKFVFFKKNYKIKNKFSPSIIKNKTVPKKKLENNKKKVKLIENIINMISFLKKNQIYNPKIVNISLKKAFNKT